MTEFRSTSTASSCTIRSFEPGDRADLLALYERVFDRDRGPDWFRWKYADNPYVDHVPIVVASDAGEVVGCRAFFALEMRVDGDERLAFQPCDTMVHPDYRKQGLFSRMNEFALERYGNRSPAFCFNFPNENAKPGNLKHGWEEIDTVPVYYRPHDPVGSVKALTDDRSGDRRGADGDAARTGGSGWIDGEDTAGLDRDLPVDDSSGDDGVATALADVVASSQRAGDRLVGDASDGLEIERFETPPAERLEAIYRRSIPDGIHTHRTAAFYRWRFRNPARSYATYVATRADGTAVAALVTSRVEDHVRIVETLPRAVEDERAAINHLLTAALADCPDRNYVTAFGQTLPTPLRYRFYPDTRFPLSRLIRPAGRTLVARDLGETGYEETTAADWTLSQLDVDTA